ncbi:MAG: prephenate dehydrogenase [Fusobacteriia bacterium 4572_74]|nr:MAG: prephenate dehydrogenase [Fusobacteriia bacterium 4572_74]
MKQKKTLSIVGLGLIGGCYAKTLRDEFDMIYGIDLDKKALSYAESEGIINKGFVDPKIPLSESDLIVICLYPNLVEKFIEKNKNNFKPNAVITDVVGVKGDLIDKIMKKLPSNIDFVGAHPMAGREVQGVWNSNEKIFSGANFIITPHPLNRNENLDLIEKLAYKMGFKMVSRITPKKHDEIISFTSQLSHAIAVALVNSDEKNFDTNVFIGDSYRDLTRIAMINEDLWDKLFMVNRENLIKKIENFEESLDIIKKSLKEGDSESLKEEFRKSTMRRKEIS